jgi:hypothetical protein
LLGGQPRGQLIESISDSNIIPVSASAKLAGRESRAAASRPSYTLDILALETCTRKAGSSYNKG